MATRVDDIAALCRRQAHLDDGESVTTVFPDRLHDTDRLRRSSDGRHGVGSGRWLAAPCTPALGEPSRLHVPARPCLCAVKPARAEALSLQGSPLDDDGVRDCKWCLRRRDDRAKAPFRPGLEAGLRAVCA